MLSGHQQMYRSPRHAQVKRNSPFLKQHILATLGNVRVKPVLRRCLMEEIKRQGDRDQIAAWWILMISCYNEWC